MGYLAGPEEPIAEMAKVANENYISPNMLAGSIVLELARSGACAHEGASARATCEASLKSNVTRSLALNQYSNVQYARFVVLLSYSKYARVISTIASQRTARC